MASKTLTVLGAKGAGKKTLIGSLIYKVRPIVPLLWLITNFGQCGMGLERLAQLESSTNGEYADIVSFFEENGIAKSFYAPSANIVVERTSLSDQATS
jgi:hypothetical protein